VLQTLLPDPDAGEVSRGSAQSDHGRVNDLLRPYPQYNAINQWFAEVFPASISRYQFKAQRPFVQGFNFLVGYNYNRARMMNSTTAWTLFSTT
jgi:hypothetical protein